MASILMSFAADVHISINVFVFYLGVITKCQSSWKPNALDTVPDFLNNLVLNEGSCVFCIVLICTDLYAKYMSLL